MEDWNTTCLLTCSINYCQTHVGCLSKQEFDEHFPSNEAQFGSLIDCGESSEGENIRRNRKNKERSKRRDEVFAEDMNDHSSCDCSRKKNQDKTGSAMISFQNCTLQCADPGNGESYWVSFEEKSFSKGQEFKVYSGRMNGIGPKAGEKCVVKVFRRCKGTENLCRCEVKKSHKAKALARAFNDLNRDKKIRIKFTTLYWAHMDEVSKIKQLFFTGERKLTTRETVIFEEDLRVNDDRPGKQRELTMFLDFQGKQRRCAAKDLEAFAHFTYHLSNGELVLCSMDGIQDEDGFYLKTPIIHSRTQQYGSSDLGLKGILEVFSNHVCSDFCKDMTKPGEDLSSLTVKNEDSVQSGSCSTAIVHEDSSVPDLVKAVHHPPFERQDTVISGGSCVGDSTMTPIQGSITSQVTESFTGYLEPSAPAEEDINESVTGSTPPPYSPMNVAHWLLQEHAKNSFLSSMPFDQMLLPLRVPTSLINQVSVESGLGVSEAAQSEGSSVRGTSMDLNANFAEGDADIPGLSTSGCVDDCPGSDRAVNFQYEKRHVRFSLSSDVLSSSSQSETVTAVTTDSAVGMSANASGTSSGHMPESPPSYIDSEMATAWWIMRRDCLSNKPMNSNMRCIENGHTRTDVGKSTHSSINSGVSNTASAITTDMQNKNQQVLMNNPAK